MNDKNSPGSQLKAEQLAKELGLPGVPMYVGFGYYLLAALITPQIAQEWIDKRNDRNRQPKMRGQNSYIDDMILGKWWTTHEGFAFSWSGHLQDGGHRARAVIASGVAIEAFVFIGLSDEACNAINQGIIRSSKDVAHYAGREASASDLSTAKAVYNGYNKTNRTISNERQLDLFDDYQDGLIWLDKHLERHTGVTTIATVRAAIVRAYLHYQNDPKSMIRLEQFCQILSSGQYLLQENISAYKLRETLKSPKYFGKYGGKARTDAYAITESAIVSFMAQRAIKRLDLANCEQFPLSHEMPAQPIAA